MRILIMGDLMGASGKEAPPVDQRPVVGLSFETFDEAFARFTPSVLLPGLGLTAPLVLKCLDEFHPDSLFRQVETFDRLRALRQRLQDPTTAAAAALELRSADAVESSDRPAGSVPSSVGKADCESDERLLDQLLGNGSGVRSEPQSRPAPKARTLVGVDALLRSIVAPHIVANEDPQLPQFLSAVDVAISDTMRRLLHDAAFQGLEATWRGIHWLLSAIDEADIEIALMHLPREDLRRVQEGGLRRHLEPRGADGAPWSLIVADWTFGSSPNDIETLRHLGALASDLESRLVASANHSLVGCEAPPTRSDPKTWELPADDAQHCDELRASAEGRAVGLTWPRIILRQPYGRKSDPIDAFAFEEMSPDHAHEDYLWGNGAFAAALTLARLHLGTARGIEGDIGDLPTFTYDEQGQPALKPCAEFCMTEQAAERVLARGIMPLVSFRNRNAVRLIRLQSLCSQTTEW